MLLMMYHPDKSLIDRYVQDQENNMQDSSQHMT